MFHKSYSDSTMWSHWYFHFFLQRKNPPEFLVKFILIHFLSSDVIHKFVDIFQRDFLPQYNSNTMPGVSQAFKVPSIPNN